MGESRLSNSSAAGWVNIELAEPINRAAESTKRAG
jgi:hypothetical protein